MSSFEKLFLQVRRASIELLFVVRSTHQYAL